MARIIVTSIDPDFTPETHTVGSSSVQSGVITTGSGLVRISTTTHCHIKFGANPTATEEDFLMPSDHVEVFAFISGQKIDPDKFPVLEQILFAAGLEFNDTVRKNLEKAGAIASEFLHSSNILGESEYV